MSSYSALGQNLNGTDPYYSFKNDIQVAISSFTRDFDSWHDMLENTNTFQNRDFKELTESLKSQYKSINRSLKELTKTIETVESNRNNYSSITTQELNDRKSFIKDMKTTINDYRSKMQSDKTREIINQHKREFEEKKKETAQEKFSRLENDRYIENHQLSQEQELKEQDVILDDMHETLKRLGVHANTINVEIKSQTALLDEVDEEMNITQDRLTRLTVKLDELMGNSNSKKIILIIILIIILVVMFYFMFN